MHAKLTTLCYVLLIVLFYYTQEGIQYPATIRLLENAICHQHYARAGDTNLPVDETLCKISVVQDRLAFIRGWYSFWTTLPGKHNVRCYVRMSYVCSSASSAALRNFLR